MKKSLRILGITLLSFLIYYVLDERYFYHVREWFYGIIPQLSVAHFIAYVLFGIPLFIGTVLITKPEQSIDSLGLKGSLIQGAGFALLFTLPMFIGYGFLFSFTDEISFDGIFIRTIAAGFFEELYFRAFLFGMIYRFTKFGFLPSIIIGALLFGSVHLYQSQDMGTMIGIFMTTFMGAILFAWMYSEWSFNLWIPVFLHLFMNLSWLLFSVSDNAFGNLWGNVFRYSTVAFAITFTVIYKKRQGKELEITGKTLWMKKVSGM